MGKSTGSAPKTPDPQAVAAAQGAADVQTAIAQARLNQVNEITPFGNATYSTTGQNFTVKDAEGKDITVPMFQREVTLSPQEQEILDLQNALTKQGYTIGGNQIGRIGEVLGQDLDFSGLPTAPTADEAARQQVQDALYGRYTSELDPRFAKEQRALETQLINQGFSRGSEGYNSALQEFNQSRNSAYDQALTSAIGGGGAEQSRLFGLQGAERERALQEMFAERNQPINELAALLGTSGGVNVPQFGGIPQTSLPGTDIAGNTYASYNADMANYQQQQQQRNSTMGSLFGLAGSALGAWASDPEMKTDMHPMSEQGMLKKVQKMPMYNYRYKATGNPNAGPMANDWAAAFGGNGRQIEAPQAFGVQMGAIKALAEKVDRMEKRMA
jgi:hypothetical protein